MSFLSRALTTSQVVMNVTASVGFLFMSYFWYQNGRSVSEARSHRLTRSSQWGVVWEGSCSQDDHSSQRSLNETGVPVAEFQNNLSPPSI